MAGKDIDINSEIVLAIADIMDEGSRSLGQRTNAFAGEWVAVRDSFDDTSKDRIDQVMTNTMAQIESRIKNQQASYLMRKYIDALKGNS